LININMNSLNSNKPMGKSPLGDIKRNGPPRQRYLDQWIR
jgi:hypothetical protein